METPPVTYYHLEGAARPLGARWLTETSLLICYSTGAIELQTNLRSPQTKLYRFARGRVQLVRAAASNTLLLGSDDGCEILAEGERALSTRSIATSLAISPGDCCIVGSGNSIILASRDGGVWLSRGLLPFERIGTLSIQDIVAGCAISNDRIVFGSSHGEFEIVSLSPFTTVAKRRAHADSIQEIVRINDSTIATVSRDRAFRVWRVGALAELAWSLADLHDHFINCAVLVGTEIWTGSSDGMIAIVSLDEQQCLRSFQAHDDAVRSLDLSPRGRRIVSSSDDGTYRIHAASNERPSKTFGRSRQYARSGAFSITDHEVRIALGSTSGLLQYGRDDGLPFRESQVSSSSLRALNYVNDQIIVGDSDGDLRTFAPADGSLVGLSSTSKGLTVIRWERGGLRLMCGYRDGHIRRFAMAEAPGRAAPTLAVSAGAASVPLPKGARVIGAVLKDRKVHDSIVGDIAEGPDGVLLSCSDDHTIKTLSPDDLGILKTTLLDSTAVNNLLVGANYLAATTDGGSTFILDVDSHAVLQRYVDHRGPVRAIAAVGDSLLATGDRTGEVRVWSPQSLMTMFSYRFHERVIELEFQSSTSRLFAITESEVASLQLDLSKVGQAKLQDGSRGQGESALRARAIDIFVSYSHRDEAFRRQLDTHLSLLKRQGKIRSWCDRHMDGGTAFNAEIRSKLLEAEIVLLLVSPDFMASDYCFEIEMDIALSRHAAGTARVVPIILRHTDWHSSPLGRLVALPRDGKPIDAWTSQDEAFLDVVVALRSMIDQTT